MQIFPCLCCGGEAHEGGYKKCNYYDLKYRPKQWIQQIENLGNYPVTDFTGLGQLIRLRLLKKLSMLPKEGVPVRLPSDPKNFYKVDVESLTPSEVMSWCMYLNLKATTLKIARKKLKFQFQKLNNTTDTYTKELENSHPYRCSAHDENTSEGYRLGLQCTENLKFEDDNIWVWIGKKCPTENCKGIIEINTIR
jgi:hypothetical protein